MYDLIKYKKTRFLKAVTGNTLSYVFRSRHTKAPLYVGWDIAAKCNCRCVMCDRWKQSSRPVDTATKTRIVEDLAKSGVWMLSLCGGEPFMDEGLFEVVAAAKKHGMLTGVSTNGSLLNENLELMGYIDNLIISVDSHSDEIHDRVRGYKGLLQKISKGIDAILAMKKRPKLNVRCLVSDFNIGQLDEYLREWHGKADEIILQPVHHVPAIGFLNENTPREGSKETASYERYLSTLRKYGMNTEYNRGIYSYLYGSKRPGADRRCFCGYYFLEIDSDCILWNCGNHCQRYGDLKEKGILELMNANMGKTREFHERRKCSCWYNCVNINIVLSKVLPSR